jgi:hypothetical protein
MQALWAGRLGLILNEYYGRIKLCPNLLPLNSITKLQYVAVIASLS